MNKASIIIVSYNEKEYLQRALDSCLRQTWANTEIVIGDDGSSDGSIDVIKAFCRQPGVHAKYFVMERPMNGTEDIIPSIRVSNLLKKGCEIASGDYFVILSADDYFIDDSKIEKAIHFLSERPAYCTYITGFKYVGAFEEECYPKTPSRILYWSGHYLHISCFVFRRPQKLLDRFCDDTGLMYSLLSEGKWEFRHELSFAYYQRSDSITRSSRQNELKMIETMLYQDCLNSAERHRHSTRARFSRPVRELFRQREILKEAQYKKFLDNSRKYEHNLPGLIADYDESSILKKTSLLFHIACMWADDVFFRIIRRLF